MSANRRGAADTDLLLTCYTLITAGIAESRFALFLEIP